MFIDDESYSNTTDDNLRQCGAEGDHKDHAADAGDNGSKGDITRGQRHDSPDDERADDRRRTPPEDHTGAGGNPFSSFKTEKD